MEREKMPLSRARGREQLPLHLIQDEEGRKSRHEPKKMLRSETETKCKYNIIIFSKRTCFIISDY
jgi:hypothetical protein